MIAMRIRLTLLLTASCALGTPAAAQSGQGWFVPGASQQTAPTPAPTHGRHGRNIAPAPVAQMPLPEPEPEAAPQDQVTDADIQEKAANLPQPPAPALPDIVSVFYSAVATGDEVKVYATGPGAALPAPLNADTNYYIIKEPALNTVELATSADNAAAGTAISLENAGAGILHVTAPVAHTGAKNVMADFSLALPSTMKLLAGGAVPPMAFVGVLGVPDVMRMSSAAQAVDKVIGERKRELQAQVQQASAELHNEENALHAEAAKLTQPQIQQKVRALQAKASADRHELQERQRIIQEAAQVALGQIERTLIGIIRQVAESRGMNLVLHRSQVALNVQEFDITDAVAAQLNRALPTVQIPPANVDPSTLPKDWGSPSATASH